ncbi:FAR-17a/AIG1-like protein [Penicillium italicum]|uniref:FAR-17a/AIG1-like protein n=1 Tax=Penicillium italicum TaxID=40296 RepID=A0A0A2L130_PENIT|nr:FAR-17a/AIG1-like protein [Penicillium italicum]
MPRLSLTTLFGVDPTTDDKHRFETSWILPPGILAGLRGLISLYIFTSIFVLWGWFGTHDEKVLIGQSFSYFTWLTYWGIGFYMLFAAIHTACYARTGRSVLFDRWPRAFRVLHSLLYVTITTYPFIVSVVFWAIIFTPPWYKETITGWQNISQHALNSAYALLEIILPTTAPHPYIALPFLILMLLFYLSVAYITHATQGWYPYTFLDVGVHGQKSKRVTGYCFGVLAAVLISFLFSWTLIHLRRRLTHGKIKRARRDSLWGQDAFVGACVSEQSSELKGEAV